jgi:transcription elongation factor Elf1
METVACRSCGRDIRFRRSLRLAQRFTCPHCGARHEVIGLKPVEVDWAFEPPIHETSSEVLVEDRIEDGDPAVA